MKKPKLSLSTSVNAKPILFFLTLSLISYATAQQSLPADFRLSGKEITKVFEPVRAVLQTSSAVVLDGRREIGYAVVASPDGFLLAKASEVAKAKKLAIIVNTQSFKDVKIITEDPIWDVVLLKIQATDLIPVRFSELGDPPQGTWVVSNGATTRSYRRALAGIISANPREIPAADGVAIGINFKNTTSLKISGLVESGGALAAGLKVGDVIISIESKKVETIEELTNELKDRKAGSTVRITYSREGKELIAEVRLSSKAELFSKGDMMDRNDLMSGDVSLRRSGFPRIIQHDTLSCGRITGGPLLNLNGDCVGMNIARVNRCENFAIPAKELREILAQLIKPSSAEPSPKAE